MLNGSFVFLADLIRDLTIDCEVDFLKVSSYWSGISMSGHIEVLKSLNRGIEGKDVLLVEYLVAGYGLDYAQRMRNKRARYRLIEQRSAFRPA